MKSASAHQCMHRCLAEAGLHSILLSRIEARGLHPDTVSMHHLTSQPAGDSEGEDRNHRENQWRAVDRWIDAAPLRNQMLIA